MLKVALRNVRAHLVRLGLSILAVVLGVSFVAGTFSLREMLSATFDGIVDASTSGDVYVRGAEGSAAYVPDGSDVTEARTPVPLSLIDTIARVDGVDRAYPIFDGSLVLVGADGTVASSGGAPTIALGYFPDDPEVTIVEGAAPSGPEQIMLEEHTAETSGLTVGDTTTIILAGEKQQVTVTGIVDFESSFAGATLVMLDEATATAAYAADGTIGKIGIWAEDGVDESTLAERVRTAVGAVSIDPPVEVVTGSDLREESREAIATMLGFIQTFLMIFAGISLFVGGFIIANTFAMTVRQRQREFALLRAVGASPLQVFTSILVQAAVIGVIGGAIGIAGGLGLVTVVKSFMSGMGMDLDGDLPVSTSMIVISLTLGVLVSILAAAFPARRAALVPPVEAMREESPAQAASLRRRGWIGTVLVGGGVGAVVAAIVGAGEEGSNSSMLLGLGAVAVVIGTLVIAPVLARSVLGVMAAPFVAWIRPLGKLARGNVTRNPRRTASTASALMIGMSLVGAASVLAASAQGSMASVIESESKADLMVQSAQMLSVPAGAVAEISALPEVGIVDSVSYDGAFVSDGTAENGVQQLPIAGTDPSMIGRSWDISPDTGDFATLSAGEVSVDSATAEAKNWVVGDTITISSRDGESADAGETSRTVRIGSTYTSMAIGTGIMMDQSMFDELIPNAQDRVQIMFVNAADGVSQEQLDAAVTAVAKTYVILDVMDNEEFISAIGQQVNQMLSVLYALLGLSIVIAILGIVNTLALSVIERTREIGLMRAVGLGRTQLAGTITIESVLTALFGTILGLAVGVGLAAGMPTVFEDFGLTELVIPWTSLAVMLGISVVVGIIAAGWPAIRAARLPVLDAVTVD